MLKKVIERIVTKRLANRINRQKLDEAEINEILGEIKKILLDADVNAQVIKQFIGDVHDKLLGQVVPPGVDPQKYLLTEIKKEFVAVLDKGDPSLNLNANPAILMLVGLQGSGKTTSCAKVAHYLKKTMKKNPLLVGLDVYRPAAIEQLGVLAKSIDTGFFEQGLQDPVLTAEKAIEYAKANKHDVVIFDTAGRLQTDQKLMQELSNIKRKTAPKEILLVVDALIGQAVVDVAKQFDDQLNLTGVLVTKLDSDASAGAIFSIASVIKKPIKLIGEGEKVEQLNKFHPDRIANRILGLGDVLTLAEKSVDVIDERTAMKSLQKMLSGKMDLEDLMIQLASMNKMGSLSSIVKMLPSIPGLSTTNLEETEERLAVWKVLLSSMTPTERKNPKLLVRDPGRRRRIVNGSGRKIDELNKLLKCWETSKRKLEQMGNLIAMGKNPFEGIF